MKFEEKFKMIVVSMWNYVKFLKKKKVSQCEILFHTLVQAELLMQFSYFSRSQKKTEKLIKINRKKEAEMKRKKKKKRNDNNVNRMYAWL